MPPPFSGISYTTLSEIFKHPPLFEGRQVRLKGKVVHVEPVASPHGKRPPLTFNLGDRTGNAVKVVAAEGAQTVTVQEGLEVTVEGRLTVLRRVGSSPSVVQVEATRIVTSPPPKKAATRPAAKLQPGTLSPPSPPVTPSEPPPLPEPEGRIF